MYLRFYTLLAIQFEVLLAILFGVLLAILFGVDPVCGNFVDNILESSILRRDYASLLSVNNLVDQL